jgi:hypothetical protein
MSLQVNTTHSYANRGLDASYEFPGIRPNGALARSSSKPSLVFRTPVGDDAPGRMGRTKGNEQPGVCMVRLGWLTRKTALRSF